MKLISEIFCVTVSNMNIYWYDYYIELYQKDKLYGQHDEGYIPCESCYEEGEYMFENEPGVKINYCLKHYEDAVRYRSDFYKSTSNKSSNTSKNSYSSKNYSSSGTRYSEYDYNKDGKVTDDELDSAIDDALEDYWDEYDW